MPEKLLDHPLLRSMFAIVCAMVAGMIARTLVSDEPFNLKHFIGELILAAMFGLAIWSVGVLQGLDFFQTFLMALVSGMGTTRSLEWLLRAAKSTKGS